MHSSFPGIDPFTIYIFYIHVIYEFYINAYNCFQTIARPEEEFYLREQVCWKYGTWFGNACRAYPTSPATVYYGPDTPFTQDIAKYIAQELGFLEQSLFLTSKSQYMKKMLLLFKSLLYIASYDIITIYGFMLWF